MAGRRVDDDPCRLVDDEQVAVLVDDLEGDGVRRSRLWGGLLEHHLHPLSRREHVPLRPRPPVDSDAPVIDQPLRRRPRADGWMGAEGDVQPYPGLIGAGLELDPVAHRPVRARGPSRT